MGAKDHESATAVKQEAAVDRRELTYENCPSDTVLDASFCAADFFVKVKARHPDCGSAMKFPKVGTMSKQAH